MGQIVDPSPSSRLPAALRASRLGLLVIGSLYSVGLLIVNLDLARYGLITLDLARAEYVMAGALWALLMISALGAIQYVEDSVKATFRSGHHKWARWLWVLVSIGVAGFFFDFVTGVLSRQQIALHNADRSSVVAYVWIISGAMSLAMSGAAVKSVLTQEQISPRSLFEGQRVLNTPIYTFAITVSLIGGYAINVHPLFPREFGGGRRTPIYLVLDQAGAARHLDLPLVKTNGRIGPVVLLFESQNMYMIKQVEDRPPSLFASPVRAPAIGIDKRFVTALITAPGPADSNEPVNPIKGSSEIDL